MLEGRKYCPSHKITFRYKHLIQVGIYKYMCTGGKQFLFDALLSKGVSINCQSGRGIAIKNLSFLFVWVILS